MAQPAVWISLLESDDEAAPPPMAQPGQTQDMPISIDEDDDVAPKSSENVLLSHFPSKSPRTALAAPPYHNLPETNGIHRDAILRVPQIQTLGKPNGSSRAQPLHSLPHQSPDPNIPIGSSLVARQTLPIPQNIPLPKFHEMPAQQQMSRLATPKRSKLTSRPRPGSSAGSPQSPDRKRMRISDSNVSRAPSVPSSKHEGSSLQNTRVVTSTYTNLQQSTIAGDHKTKSPLIRSHNEEMKRSSSPRGILSQTMSTGSTKRGRSTLTDHDMFPLCNSIGEDKLRSMSTDIHSQLIESVADGQRAIYGILTAAKSMSDLADQILGNFAESANKALAQEIKSDFDKSFRNLQEENAIFTIPEDRKVAWVTAAICHAITSIGKMALPEPQSMPQKDAAVLQGLKGTLDTAVDAAPPAVEKDDQDVNMIARDESGGRAGNFIRKCAYYRDVDVLRLKGMSAGEPRPYISSKTKELCQLGAANYKSKEALKGKESRIVSVPFMVEELQAVHDVVLEWYNDPRRTAIDMDKASRHAHENDFLSTIASHIVSSVLTTPKRSRNEYAEFLGEFESIAKFLRSPQKAEQDTQPLAVVRRRISRAALGNGGSSGVIQALFRTREMAENIDRSTQQLQSLVLSQLDDSFARDIEFSGGPGDIASFTWLSEDHFISGAITNCDLYNQDYNKPGNIVFGSAKTKIARAIPGHRISRPPKPHKKDTVAIDSQDPWLYTSVPMTVFDSVRNLCFTAAYDKTVKIWRASNDKLAMDLLGTWDHDGHVNLIVNSPHHSKVATASDVKCDGIRVYDLEKGDLRSLRPRMYSGSRARDCADKKLDWAYYPATMQWGSCSTASHFLAVGYSPRALEVHSDVPWDKKNSGQLCVWDTFSKTEVSITGPKAQNVFEVVWHPSQVVFVAATSAAGAYDEGVKTQLRLFVYKEATDVFAAVKTFECFGADINEITLRPSSYKEMYLTASCTDRKTYVWDSALGCYPIHILCHDVPIDQIDEKADAEEVDAGVKFAAWGRTADRFFTGSSDGVLKAWNIRAQRGQEFVGDILYASGGISCGLFSPDRTRLAVGDTSGKIHLLKIGDIEFDEKPVYTRTAIRPFYEPAPPIAGGVERAHAFLANQQICLHRDKYIGAIQGPNYATTKLYRAEKHVGGDLESIPDDVLQGQKDRKYREKLDLPRLLSVTDVHSPIHSLKSKAAAIFEKLCSCGLDVKEARLVASRCGAMGMGLAGCAEIFKEQLDIHVPLPDSYEAEAEMGDFFQKDELSSSASGLEHPSHHLSEQEISQFTKLKDLITTESLNRKAFREIQNNEA